MKRYFLPLSAVCLCLVQKDKQRISSTSSVSPHLLLSLKRRTALFSFCLVQFGSESDEDNLNFAWNGYPEEKISQWA